DLTVLPEAHAANLDLYAAALPAGIDAVTDFAPKARPRVRVTAVLSAQKRYATRLRSTLAHELAHVVLHDFLVWLEAPTPRQSCGTRHAAAATDWMEWQANYVAGALLMPAVQMTLVLGRPQAEWTRASRGPLLVPGPQAALQVS